MSELRFHPFLQEWVITATHRQDRTFFPPDDFCPLCPTKNPDVPTEIPVETFDIAVFENRFPSLSIPPPEPALPANLFPQVQSSVGVCEVVVYTPRHQATLSDLSVAHVNRLCHVWKDRYVALSALPEINYVYIFENKGKEIGVTLSHPHGQIYAYPFVPRVIQLRIDAAEAHKRTQGSQLAADWLDYELLENKRIIERNRAFVTLVPYFARYPYEIHIIPTDPLPSLAHMDDKLLLFLAESLSSAVRRLDRLFGFSMPYIMSLFQTENDATRFSVEITPPYRTQDKLKYLAGSEAGCGIFINDVLPEEAAARLRSA